MFPHRRLRLCPWAPMAERRARSRLHSEGSAAVTTPLSLETEDLLEAADRAVARSRELVHQRRQLIVELETQRRAQEERFAFHREIFRPK